MDDLKQDTLDSKAVPAEALERMVRPLTHHEESAGLVSASKFEMVAACEGQPQFEAQLREQLMIEELPADEQAERGIRIHRAWETNDTSGLSEEEIADFERTKEIDLELMDQWLNDKGPIDVDKTEERLWLRDDDGNGLASGRYDRLSISGHHAFVRDLKSGWCKRLTPSQQSWQLRLLAVLVWLEYGPRYGFESVRVAFVKPKLRNATDVAEYSLNDLHRSMVSVRQILWRSQQPDVKRQAGDHCFYCVCRKWCREAAAYSMLPSVIAGAQSPVKKAEVEIMVQRLTPADWVKIHQVGTMTANIVAEARRCLKTLTADDLRKFGLQVGEGRRLDPITNVIGAYKALEHSLPPEALWDCLSFEKGKIVEAVQTSTNMTKKDAQQWVRETLSPFVTEERASGSLEETDD